MDADRLHAVASRLFEYVKSPSLRHLREPHSVQKLAREIVQAKDKRWTLSRIKEISDPGTVLGVYQNRRDANTALQEIAYAAELSR